MSGRFTPQRDLGVVDAEHRWVAERGTSRKLHEAAGQESQFHQTARVGLGQIEALDPSFLPAREVCKRTLDGDGHVAYSIDLVATRCQSGTGAAATASNTAGTFARVWKKLLDSADSPGLQPGAARNRPLTAFPLFLDPLERIK